MPFTGGILLDRGPGLQAVGTPGAEPDSASSITELQLAALKPRHSPCHALVPCSQCYPALDFCLSVLSRHSEKDAVIQEKKQENPTQLMTAIPCRSVDEGVAARTSPNMKLLAAKIHQNAWTIYAKFR